MAPAQIETEEEAEDCAAAMAHIMVKADEYSDRDFAEAVGQGGLHRSMPPYISGPVLVQDGRKMALRRGLQLVSAPVPEPTFSVYKLGKSTSSLGIEFMKLANLYVTKIDE